MARRTPAFLPTPRGGVFVLEVAPLVEGIDAPTAIVVPAFAEEMNRCRRMTALLAEQLAARGSRTLVFDFGGTGDSYGDFAVARIAHWRADLDCVAQHALTRGAKQLVWIGIRFGALLACEAAARWPQTTRVAVWQPALSGRQIINQWLRLDRAAALVAGAGAAAGGATPQRLRDDAASEIAGYTLTRELQDDVSGLALATALAELRCPVGWFEMVARDDQALASASQRLIAQIRERAPGIRGEAVVGPAFWGTSEITVSARLIESSCSFLAG